MKTVVQSKHFMEAEKYDCAGNSIETTLTNLTLLGVWICFKRLVH